MNRTKILVLLLLLLTFRLASAHKVPEAAWQRGTLASVETETQWPQEEYTEGVHLVTMQTRHGDRILPQALSARIPLLRRNT